MPKVMKKGAWEKKSWYTVVAPEFLGQKPVAKTPVVKAQDLIGRTIAVPLNEITGDLRHYQVELKLRIAKVKDETALAEYGGQELIRDVVARMIRRWSSRIDVVQEVVTKDKARMRLKGLIVTTRRVNKTIQSSIRKEAAAQIAAWAKDKTLADIVVAINFGKFLGSLAARLKKIYPVRAVEMRRIEVLK